ncbi:hypothetical protein J2Y60_001848 [Arcicella sp. BE140]|nr:hypothetical protein [Arcicella sp. BE51]MDR6811650.1 hypothetical protein [Arcicella sp. BE140]MDR6823175.1 hypothetical protein [Arcicella sp. BE139]
MRLILMQFGKDIKATQDDKYDFVISVAQGQINYEEIVAWIIKQQVDK